WLDGRGQPVAPVSLAAFRQPRPRDPPVVAPARDPLEPSAPKLAQLPLDLVPRHGVTRRARDGETETRLARLALTLEPVENEKPSRGRAPLPVDGVKVPRTRQAIPLVHVCRLSGEPLPAFRATAFQDRLTGTRRHARAEAVTTLPPAHVWLVGPLHEDEERRKITPKGEAAAPVYPSGRTQSSPQPKVLQRRRNVTFRHASST